MPGRAVHEAIARESCQIHGVICRFQTDGNIYGTFVIDTNEFTVSITEDGKRESVTYAN